MKTVVPTPVGYRWVRSPKGLIAGVCEGLGRSFNVEPWVLRVLWILSIFVLGSGLLLYVICAVCLPREDRLYKADQKMVLGVCARISHSANMEIGLVRLLTVLLALASAGATVVGYIILHFVLPQDPARRQSLF